MAYYSLKLEIEKRPVYIGQEDTDKFFSDENTLYDPVIGEMPSPIPADCIVPYKKDESNEKK